jgi:hypothetical protein
MRDSRGAYRVLEGKHVVKRPLRRPRSKWDGNIKMDLHEAGWEAWTGVVCLRAGTGGGLL